MTTEVVGHLCCCEWFSIWFGKWIRVLSFSLLNVDWIIQTRICLLVLTLSIIIEINSRLHRSCCLFTNCISFKYIFSFILVSVIHAIFYFLSSLGIDIWQFIGVSHVTDFFLVNHSIVYTSLSIDILSSLNLCPSWSWINLNRFISRNIGKICTCSSK